MKKRKILRDEAGASLPLALLLFLTCTLVSAVVLAAATTATGTHARQAELDQDYYSVSSAALLVSRSLGGAPVEVSVTRDYDETVTVAPDGRRTTSAGEASYDARVDGRPLFGAAPGQPTLRQLAAADLVGAGPGSLSSARALWDSGLAFDAPPGLSLSLSHDMSVPAGSGFTASQLEGVLAVDVDGELSDDGSLALTFSRSGAGAGSYEITSKFTARYSLDEGTSYGEPQVSASGGSVTETRHVTEEKKLSVSWEHVSTGKAVG